MGNRWAWVVAVGVMLLIAGPASAAAILSGPSPYLCFDRAAITGCGTADSPFRALSPLSLETFEDNLFNTPGVSASTGSIVAPGGITDSVDADDGTIDGSGTGGHTLFAGGFPGITFTFTNVTLPTHAGIVWTDGAGTISFSASGPGGLLAPCTVSGYSDAGSPDGGISGTTAEDRFFGCSDPAGISSIHIENSSGGIEVDHLQFTSAEAAGRGPDTPGVPAPAALILMGSGLMGVALAKRLRRRS